MLYVAAKYDLPRGFMLTIELIIALKDVVK